MITPFAVEGADDRQVLDGTLVEQSGQWWLRIDGQPALWGPLQNDSGATAGTRACVAVAQGGTLYVVWPGKVGGGGTPGGGDKNYVHDQSAPSMVWTVTHNLDKFPAVNVVDTGGSVVLPNVTYTDINNVTLTFGSPTSGKAYVN